MAAFALSSSVQAEESQELVRLRDFQFWAVVDAEEGKSLRQKLRLARALHLLEPEIARAHLARSLNRDELKCLEEALSIFDALSHSDQKETTAYAQLARGRRAEMVGDINEAIRWFKEAHWGDEGTTDFVAAKVSDFKARLQRAVP